MSATEELRRLLDERGVEWWPMRNNDYYEERDTEFVANGKKHTAHEWGNGLAVYNLTPEQAIAATLGSGTCHFEEYERTGIYVCSECGATAPDDFTVHYCWCCGAKVVE